MIYYIWTFWALFVTASYYVYHKDFFLNSINQYFSFPELLLFITVCLAILSTAIFTLKAKYKIRIWHLILLILILIPILSSIRFYWDDFYVYEGETLMAGESIYMQTGDPVVNPEISKPEAYSLYKDSFVGIPPLQTLINFSKNILIPIFFTFLMFLGFYGQGSLIEKLLKTPKLGPKSAFIKIALGTLFSTIALFCIAKLNLLNTYVLWGLLLLSILSGAKDVLKSKCLSTELKFSNSIWMLLTLSSLLLIFNFIEIAEPLPGGYDDFNVYLNLPNLLMQHEGFIHYSYPYAFSLLQSFALIISNTIVTAKLLVLGFFILSTLLILDFSKKFSSEKTAMLITSAFIFIPSIFIHSYLQTKTEMPLVFLGTLSVYLIYEWFETAKSDIGKTKLLILAGLFAGLSFSIKITAILLIISLFIFPLLKFSFKSEKQKILKNILILGFSILIPILPWLVSNVISNKSLEPRLLIFDTQGGGPYFTYEEIGLNPNYCEYSGAADADYARYQSDRSGIFAKYIMLPWDLSMTISQKTLLTNIGFLFLAFLPILIFQTKKLNNNQNKKYLTLALAGLIYWFLWTIIGKGVIWYGFSGFIFLMLALLAAINILEKEKIAKHFACGLLIIFIVLGLILRSNIFVSRTQYSMPYLSGLFDKEGFINYQYPSIRYFLEVLNENPESTILMNNAVNLRYMIEKNDERIVFDQYYEFLDCAFNEKVDDIFKERLQKIGFSFLVLEKHEEDFYTQYIQERENAVFNFANKNLQLIITDNTTYIYEIPPLEI